MLWRKICPFPLIRKASLLLGERPPSLRIALPVIDSDANCLCLGLAATIWTKPTNAIALNLILHSFWCNSCNKIISRFGWLSSFLLGFVDGLEFKRNDFKQEWKKQEQVGFLLLRSPCVALFPLQHQKCLTNIIFCKSTNIKLFWCKTNFSIPENVNCRISYDPD